MEITINWNYHINLIITLKIVLIAMYWALKFLQAIKTDRPIETVLPRFPNARLLTKGQEEKEKEIHNREISKFS